MMPHTPTNNGVVMVRATGIVALPLLHFARTVLLLLLPLPATRAYSAHKHAILLFLLRARRHMLRCLSAYAFAGQVLPYLGISVGACNALPRADRDPCMRTPRVPAHSSATTRLIAMYLLPYPSLLLHDKTFSLRWRAKNMPRYNDYTTTRAHRTFCVCGSSPYLRGRFVAVAYAICIIILHQLFSQRIYSSLLYMMTLTCVIDKPIVRRSATATPTLQPSFSL